MVDLQDRIASLPGDLFSIKSVYLETLQSIAPSDINSAVVLLGKAGERLAKGDTARHVRPGCRPLLILRGGSYDFLLVIRIVVTVNGALLARRYYNKRRTPR